MAPFARAAEPLLISEAYWVDESGKATLEDAASARFVNFKGSLSVGYEPFALWLKLRVSGQDTLKQLALTVHPAFIRRIELYDPYLHDSNELLMPVISGRDASITATNHLGFENGFVIPASKEARDIFLRITTTTTLTAGVELQSLDEADYATHVTGGTLAIFLAFLLAFLLWSLVSWAVRRELIYGMFALRLLLTMIHTFVWLGPLRYFFSSTLSAEVRDHVYNVSTVLLVAVSASFNVKLISEFGVSQWLQKIAWYVVGLSAVPLLFLLLGMPQTALYFNSIVVSIGLIMSVVMSLFGIDMKNRPYGRLAVNLVRVGFLAMAIVVVVPSLVFHSVMQANVQFTKVLFLHAVISTVILFAILSIRARHKDLMAQQALVQYKIKERELLKESERRVEKERFLSMLTHELRNPLSVIRLMTSEGSSSGKAVHRAALDMVQIIERVEQSEKLEDACVQDQKAICDLGSVLRNIAMEHPALSRLDVEAPACLTVNTDEDLFRSIVGNLLDNAAKYSPDGSRIQLLLADRSSGGVDGVQLSILNETGEAGAPEVQKVFTKYYRSKGAHRRPGSGLGLFLVAGWTKTLGGNVSYEQIDGANGKPFVRFSLWLPK
jgi:signal transduction histidine kinase